MLSLLLFQPPFSKGGGTDACVKCRRVSAKRRRIIFRIPKTTLSHRASAFDDSSLRKGSLLFIYLRLEYADIGQVTVIFLIIQTVADHKFIGHVKADIVYVDLDLTA